HRGVGTRCARTRARTRTGGALLTGTARLLTRLRHALRGRERVVAGACSLAALTAGASARLGSATAGLRHTLRRGEGVVARACGRPAAGLRGRRLRSGGLGCCRLRGGGLGGTGLRSGGLGRRCTVGLGLGCRGLGGLGLLGCGRGGLGARLRCGLRRRVARLGGARFRRGSLGPGFAPGLGAGLAPGFGAPGFAAGLAADFFSPPEDFAPSAGAESAKASLTRRTTGASSVEEAERTNSPISWSFSRTFLLVVPSSFASSWTRGFATVLL